MPVLIKAALIHAQFETIHPFLDGNGRLGRLLITFFLIKESVLPRPILYLSRYFKENRQSYYEKLNGYRSDKIQQWIEFFLEGVSLISEDAVEKAKKIMKLRENDLNAISYFGKSAPNANKVLDELYKNAIIDAKIIGKITGIKSRTNIYNLIHKFVNANILEELYPKKKNKVFVHKKYYRLFNA